MNKTNSLKRLTMLGAMMAAMLMGTAQAQTYYVFYNSNVGYIRNDNGTLAVSGNSDFTPSSVWIASGNLANSNNNLRTIRSYVDNTKYMVGNGNGSQMSLGNSHQYWRIYNNYLYHRNYYYVISASGTLYTYNSTSYERFTPTAISTPSTSSVITVTASISGDDVISSSGNYTYTGNTGTTTVSYTLFTISGNDHYWYNDEDHDSAPAPSNQSWGTITKTWSLSGADGYATVNSSTGEVTVTNVPLSPKIITLTLIAEDGTHSVTISKHITLSTTPSSVSGGKVVLNDLEDHTWTYYSGIDVSIDGGNYNTNYAGKIYSPNPRNVKITYRGKNDVSGSTTVVKVSRTENDSVFIYYKTLEQGTTTGEYPYQVISNPFSVRPSTGSGNSKVYYGFAGWKIVSGGDYIKNHSTGDVLSLDENIVFENLPYSSVNCTSAEIVFQTTWTQADVRTGNNIATMLGNFSGGTYETNFAVLTGAYTTAWTGNKNATITSVYPDGSSDVRSTTNYTTPNVTVSSGFTIKYEYININDNSSTLSMGSGTKTLYIGRGVSNTTAGGLCCNLIQGFGGNNNITGGLTYTLKIESGVYNYLSFVRGYDGGSTTNTVTGTIAIKSVLGCDYDRAKGQSANSNMKIQEQIMLGYTSDGYQTLQSPSAGDEVLNVTLKSGSLNSNMTSAGMADASQSFYIGIGGEYSPGYRVFTMEGGEMWSLAAGICKNTATTNSVRFRIKGGLVKGSIYGSAANANSFGYKQMIITGGQVKGWVAGGGNGTSNNGGTTTGSTYIYIGGNCRIDSEGSNTKINSSLGGQVFGSGSGVDGSTTWGEMLYGTNVVVADNAYIERNVFGGGNFGWTDQTANIYLTGGTMSVGNVFGGANQNKGEYVNIYMTGGTVREDLYGGSNVSGNISGAVAVKVYGGSVEGAVYGCNNAGGAPQSTVNVDIYGTDAAPSANTYAIGQVYGGGNQAAYTGTPVVTVHCGADPETPISIGELYGGGNEAEVTGTNVTIEAGNIIGDVYGGGRKANVGNGGTSVTINGGTIRRVFGGNNISGTIAGGNTDNKISVNVDKTSSCPMMIGQVYGGGNEADSRVGNITIGCTGTLTDAHRAVAADAGATPPSAIGYTLEGIGDVYGGANNATITGNVTLNINSGIIYRVFGANNTGKKVTGTITVNIAKNSGATCASDWYVGYVFGGGNNAPYGTAGNNYPAVNHTAGKVTYNVYGGGKGNTAIVTGNPQVTLSGTAEVGGNVYGGGDAAAVTGSTKVTLRD